MSTVALGASLATTGCTDDAAPASSTGTIAAGASFTTGAASTTTVPASPEQVARTLTDAERGIKDETLPAAASDRWGRAQQGAYRQLVKRPEWEAPARALLPDDLRASFDRNSEARRAVADHAAGRPPVPPSATLPAWTIVAPRSAQELLSYYHEAEAITGVPWEYLAAINLMETRLGRIVGVSSAGARGPMQFLPTTWARCCAGDINDPHDAIIGAARYLVRRGAPADMPAALYGYNPNEGYVGAVTAYAHNMMENPRAFYGYHGWEVYVSTSAGTVRLPVGYSQSAPTPAADYLATHPEDRAIP